MYKVILPIHIFLKEIYRNQPAKSKNYTFITTRILVVLSPFFVHQNTSFGAPVILFNLVLLTPLLIKSTIEVLASFTAYRTFSHFGLKICTKPFVFLLTIFPLRFFVLALLGKAFWWRHRGGNCSNLSRGWAWVRNLLFVFEVERPLRFWIRSLRLTLLELLFFKPLCFGFVAKMLFKFPLFVHFKLSFSFLCLAP